MSTSSVKIHLTDIFDDLIQENKRLEEEFEFAKKCLSILTEFKDLLIKQLNFEHNSVILGFKEITEQMLSFDVLELLIDCMGRYSKTVVEKESKNKSEANSSTGIQIYPSLVNQSVEEVNGVFEDFIEYNKELQRNMIIANKQLEVVIKIYDRFSFILEKNMSTVDQKTAIKLSSDDILVFVTFNREVDQLTQQNISSDEKVNDNCAQRENVELNDISQDENQSSKQVENQSERTLALNVSEESSSNQETRDSLGSDIRNKINEVIENIAIKEENDLSQEAIGKNKRDKKMSITTDPDKSLTVIYPEVKCGLRFSNHKSMLAHKCRSHPLNSEPKNMIYRLCDICGFSTLCVSTFTGHMNIHSGKYKCNRCNFKAGFLCLLKKHNCLSHYRPTSVNEDVNNNPKTQILENGSAYEDNSDALFPKANDDAINDNTDLTLDDLSVNRWTQKSNDISNISEILFKCPFKYCSYESKSKSEFVDHRRQNHNKGISKNDNSVFRCNVCSLTYTLKFNLIRHMSYHSMNQVLDRSKGNAFRSSSLPKNQCKRQKEQVSDSKATANQFPIQKGNIQKASDEQKKGPNKSHEKIFTCDDITCGRKFTSKSGLLNHQRWSLSHSGNYKCLQCQYRAGSSDHLKRHIRERHRVAVRNYRITDLKKSSIRYPNADDQNDHMSGQLKMS